MTNDFLTIAILESKGIITPAEAEALQHVAVVVTPLDLDSARSTVHDALTEVGTWDTCEICRRLGLDYRMNLAAHHANGHPFPTVTVEQPSEGS